MADAGGAGREVNSTAAGAVAALCS